MRNVDAGNDQRNEVEEDQFRKDFLNDIFALEAVEGIHSYPHRESPLENLKMIREKGMDAFLEYERQHWTCPVCGNPFSVHNRKCVKCKTMLK